MKHLLLFLPALLFIIASCSENEPTEPTTYTDAELKSKIVGTWFDEYGNIKYKPDGNFTNYVDIDYTINDSTITQTELIKGTYDIIDGILRYTNVNEWYVINGYGSGGSIPNFEIKLEGDLLYLYPLNILDRVGNGADSLWGEWYTFNWYHIYNDPTLFGKLEQTYNFSKDSMIVTLGVRYDSSQVYYYDSRPLVYNPPEVSWDGNSTWITEFHGGQMWMFYKLNQPPKPLKKVE
ncbi:MAG: hypothetical protein B6D44_08220 [Ignavibacteriales bacterium UTCHB2]|jgi:hypothetical protein|nr:MAG: hypothetical protein B6D44_08220 [Ignavibacteriales bacterium UTCHB2]